jgi:hypothetical protein
MLFQVQHPDLYPLLPSLPIPNQLLFQDILELPYIRHHPF